MTDRLREYHNELLFVPLGGSNEIGMNLNLYHLNGKWLMVDLGIGFADDYLPGIEVLLPDIEFIVEHREDLLGLVLTHAHEDHLGAVTYLWDELQCPVYATPFTASVLRHKMMGEGIVGSIPIHELKVGSKLELGPFKLDLITVTHSIPEMQAIAIETERGVIMHTGDWKLDPNPMVGAVTDEDALKRYGKNGVLAMVCDSTNVFVEGESASEGDVRKALAKEISEQKERVFITTFASNIARVESILRAAEDAGRQVVLAGRSLWRMLDAAQSSGYLTDIKPVMTDKQAAGLPRNEVLVLCTGCQGEPRAALAQIVAMTHPTLRMATGDTVIFSSRVIPGNETRVRWLTNQIIKQGGTIITDRDADIHASGHPARGELKRMYEMVKPHIAVPVHGETAHIHEHAAFARSLGVPEVVIGRNGAVIHLDPEKPMIIDEVHSGYIAMDGVSMIAVNSPVIRFRRKLREEGNITISFVLDKNWRILSSPEITAPGSLDPNEDESLRHALADDVVKVIETIGKKPTINHIKEKVRSAVRKRIQNELGKRPVLEVHVHQV
ncbi:MAG: ribonuclease J [Rickettsiales bacterium]